MGRAAQRGLSRCAVTFAIPGDLSARTGGYIYDARVLRLLPDFGIDVTHLELPAAFPRPDAADLDITLTRLNAVPAHHILLVDGLAFGAFPGPLLKRLENPAVALVHHPLGLETGLPVAERGAFIERERQALTCAAHIIVTSGWTRRILMDSFGAAGGRITVAEPGTDKAPQASGGLGASLNLLAVGAVIPRKGYTFLIEALSRLTALDWKMRIIGGVDRDLACARALRAQIENSGLAHRVELCGELSEDDLRATYQSADIFVMPSLLEGYGMALAEAMACGLPIVATRAGASCETVPDGAAVKIDAGDGAQLEGALCSLICDSARRTELCAASWAAGRRLKDWTDTACVIAGCLAAVAARRGAAVS